MLDVRGNGVPLWVGMQLNLFANLGMSSYEGEMTAHLIIDLVVAKKAEI